MNINKAFKFRLYPNKAQEEALAKCFGSYRFVYNYFLNERKIQYEQTGKSHNFYEQCKDLTNLKNKDAYKWLYEVNSQSLQSALHNVETAYNNFFSKRTGFPKFHSKKSRQSFEVTQSIKLINNKFFMPKFKVGIKCKVSKIINGKICSATIIKEPSNKYYVSIICEQNIEVGNKDKKEIGIDLGIKDLIITSEGVKYSNPKFIEKYKKELKEAQQHLSRKKKGSKGFESQKIKVAKIHEKIVNCRLDNLHKISYKLTNQFSDIYLEDLNVKKMQKNKLLSKYITDASWSTFIHMLEYKGKWYGCNIHKIERFYPSSKTCSNCNHTLNSLGLNIRSWTCPICGKKHDRDINAAINILKEGKRELSAGTVDYTGREKIRLKEHKCSKQISKKPESYD